MIHIITAENRHLYHHALMEMHRQRKELFIDELKWRLDETAGIEIDAYDSPEAVYLIEAETPRAPVTGSVRLLPTDRPHLLGQVFPQLCATPAPSGANVWEATRFCPGPEIERGEGRRKLLGRMIAAIVETALLFGIDEITFVAHGAMAPLARDAGWKARALGPSQRVGRERLTAFASTIDSEALRNVRLRNGIRTPLARFAAGTLAAAA